MIDVCIGIIVYLLLWLILYLGDKKQKLLQNHESALQKTQSTFKKILNPFQIEEIKNNINLIELKINKISFVSTFAPVKYERSFYDRSFPSNAITEEEVKLLLSIKSLNDLYGIQLLRPMNAKSLPVLSSDILNIDDEYLKKKINVIKQRIHDIRVAIVRDLEKCNKFQLTYNSGQQSAIEEAVRLTLRKHAIPDCFQVNVDIAYQVENRIIVVVLETNDLSSIKIMKRKKTTFSEWIELSSKNQKKLKEDLLYSLCIRIGYLTARSDINNYIDLIVVNIKQKWFDPATGILKDGIIASFQGEKEQLALIQLDKIEPKACFRYFKGISTPSIEHLMPIKPAFDLNMNDKRIIENKNVSDYLDPDANLAEMPWDEFEHLVRQLFEWEFGNKGIEVKITCASRDRGVDAIMYDSDPLKGGKYVVQAKRYNRTVDVAAVRDLYGTVVNEGANRGILVTTSSYGPDTYEFAKDKPISLIDGQHLVQMLKKHGKNYHIKLNK